MNPQITKGSLRRVPWEDVGALVKIPFWRSEVAKFGPLLQGTRAGSLPDLLKRLPEIGSRIPDPKGRRLTPKERTVNAVQLVAMAINLLLLEKGWPLQTEPAMSHPRRADDKLNAFELVNDLAAGKLSSEDWVQKCTDLGIAEEALGIVKSQPISLPAV